MQRSHFRFTFKPAQASQRELIHEWLKQDYIREWIHGAGLQNTLTGLEKFFQYCAEGKALDRHTKITQHWIGYDGDKPFVYLLTSHVFKNEPSEYAQYSETNGPMMTLDIFIGESDYLGKGLAALLIKEFLLSQCSDVSEIFIDPEKSNQKATHVYEKVGFRIVGDFIASWHPVPHHIMKLNMKDIQAPVESHPIIVREYHPEDAEALANIYYNTIHHINVRDYSEAQVNAWAPTTSLNAEGWMKKWDKLKPFVAVINNSVVGFAEFEPNGHIDCFYCHHEWIGKGVGSALMQAIEAQAQQAHIPRIFAEVSITAKPFFESKGFRVVKQQTIVRKGIELTNFVMEKM